MNIINLFVILFASCVIDQSFGLEKLPAVEENDIARTEAIIRTTTNTLFAIFNFRNLHQQPKIKQYATIHKYFISLTLQDYDSLNEIAKLTKANNNKISDKIIADLIELLNEILDDDNVVKIGNALNGQAKDRFDISGELEKIEFMKNLYVEPDAVPDINEQILNILKEEESNIEKDLVNDTSNPDSLLDLENITFSDEQGYWRPDEASRLTRRIYGGYNTKIRHYPFMASVQIFGSFQCGSSIIKSDLIITSASCLQLAWNNRFYRENPAFLSVRVGSTFIESGGESIPIMEIYFYPTYNPRNLNDNIALMRTRRHIKWKRKVKRIEIDTKAHPLPVNTDGVVILGWGAKRRSNILDSTFRNRLHYSVLDIYPNIDCRDIYSKDYITRKTFCAGFISRGSGACNRDAGGPGVVGGVLAGIVSFGAPNCGTLDAPTVFTKVGYYSDWIEEIMDQDVPVVKKRTTLRPAKYPYFPALGEHIQTRWTVTPYGRKNNYTMEPVFSYKPLEHEPKPKEVSDKDKDMFKDFLKTMFDSKEIQEIQKIEPLLPLSSPVTPLEPPVITRLVSSPRPASITPRITLLFATPKIFPVTEPLALRSTSKIQKMESTTQPETKRISRTISKTTRTQDGITPKPNKISILSLSSSSSSSSSSTSDEDVHTLMIEQRPVVLDTTTKHVMERTLSVTPHMGTVKDNNTSKVSYSIADDLNLDKELEERILDLILDIGKSNQSFTTRKQLTTKVYNHKNIVMPKPKKSKRPSEPKIFNEPGLLKGSKIMKESKSSKGPENKLGNGKGLRNQIDEAIMSLLYLSEGEQSKNTSLPIDKLNKDSKQLGIKNQVEFEEFNQPVTENDKHKKDSKNPKYDSHYAVNNTVVGSKSISTKILLEVINEVLAEEAKKEGKEQVRENTQPEESDYASSDKISVEIEESSRSENETGSMEPQGAIRTTAILEEYLRPWRPKHANILRNRPSKNLPMITSQYPPDIGVLPFTTRDSNINLSKNGNDKIQESRHKKVLKFLKIFSFMPFSSTNEMEMIITTTPKIHIAESLLTYPYYIPLPVMLNEPNKQRTLVKNPDVSTNPHTTVNKNMFWEESRPKPIENKRRPYPKVESASSNVYRTHYPKLLLRDNKHKGAIIPHSLNRFKNHNLYNLSDSLKLKLATTNAEQNVLVLLKLYHSLLDGYKEVLLNGSIDNPDKRKTFSSKGEGIGSYFEFNREKHIQPYLKDEDSSEKHSTDNFRESVRGFNLMSPLQRFTKVTQPSTETGTSASPAGNTKTLATADSDLSDNKDS